MTDVRYYHVVAGMIAGQRVRGGVVGYHAAGGTIEVEYSETDLGGSAGCEIAPCSAAYGCGRTSTGTRPVHASCARAHTSSRARSSTPGTEHGRCPMRQFLLLIVAMLLLAACSQQALQPAQATAEAVIQQVAPTAKAAIEQVAPTV